MIEQIKQLKSDIESNFHPTGIDMRIFDSGAVSLDTLINEYLVVFEFSPKEGFGIYAGKGDEELYNPKICQAFNKDHFENAKVFLFEIFKKLSA